MKLRLQAAMAAVVLVLAACAAPPATSTKLEGYGDKLTDVVVLFIKYQRAEDSEDKSRAFEVGNNLVERDFGLLEQSVLAELPDLMAQSGLKSSVKAISVKKGGLDFDELAAAAGPGAAKVLVIHQGTMKGFCRSAPTSCLVDLGVQTSVMDVKARKIPWRSNLVLPFGNASDGIAAREYWRMTRERLVADGMLGQGQPTPQVILSPQPAVLDRPVAVEWEGMDGPLAALVRIVPGGKTAAIDVTVPGGAGRCQGSMVPNTKEAGTWTLACPNGLTAKGEYQAFGPGKGSRGEGVDSQGRKIRYNLGALSADQSRPIGKAPTREQQQAIIDHLLAVGNWPTRTSAKPMVALVKVSLHPDASVENVVVAPATKDDDVPDFPAMADRIRAGLTKASPLPIPEDQRAFYKNFTLRVEGDLPKAQPAPQPLQYK